MNLLKMLEAQRELDEFAFKRSGIETYPLQEIQLALKVELGELAQEWGEFKYWKKSRTTTDKDKLIEEWADCMHFALSLENNYNNGIEHIFEWCDRIGENLDVYRSFEYASRDLALDLIIVLGRKLGFADKEMEKAYFDKNKKNWDRMRGNY